MLKTNIFAGGIANLTDARYFAARGAQYLSFNLDAATDLSISPEKMAAIKEWVEGPYFIGAFQLTSIEDIRFLVDRLKLNMVQLGPFIALEELEDYSIRVPLIREVVIELLSDLNTLQNQLKTLSGIFDFTLINFEKNGFSWTMIKNNPVAITQLKNFNSYTKLVLAITHLPSEAHEILNVLNPYGLYLQGGAEEKTGFKSFDELDDIFDVLELEEN